MRLLSHFKTGKGIAMSDLATSLIQPDIERPKSSRPSTLDSLHPVLPFSTSQSTVPSQLTTLPSNASTPQLTPDCGTPTHSQATSTSNATLEAESEQDSTEYHFRYFLAKAMKAYPVIVTPQILTSTSSLPALQHDGRLHRILVYYGCFNPPHTAHLNLLRHAYKQSHESFHIIGAVIIPVGDNTCSSKFNHDLSLLYTLSERINLWEQDHAFPAWACVLEKKAWNDIRPKLQGFVKEEGFEVSFLTVCGPDQVDDGDGGWVRSYDAFHEILVCDTGREAGFDLGADGMRDLDGCSSWSKAALGEIAEMDGKEDTRLGGQREYDLKGLFYLIFCGIF